MKKLGIITLLLAMMGIAFAKPVSQDVARRVAQTWMQAQGMKNPAALQDITSQTPFTEFYVFAAEEGGFIIVSGDDCVRPVLGYSLTSRFDTKRDIPVNVRGWLDDYEKEIRHWKNIEAHYGGVHAENYEAVSDWQMLANGEMPPAPLTTAVSPLLTTTWDQYPYYNALCPYDAQEVYTGNNHIVTGCVATATAQIMKFWNYPTTGYGSHSYVHHNYDETTSYGTLSANFGNTTYQWNNMPNELTASSSDAQVNAVATIMYHIGVADEMIYDLAINGGSGAHNHNTNNLRASSQSSLMAYFKYRPDMTVICRDDYSYDEYCSRLRAELDQQRPILYSGSGNGGHSFVCDGYNEQNQFRINWGWGGSYDGYFSVGAFTPGGGGAGSNSNHQYSYDNIAILGIRPHEGWNTTTTVGVTMTGGNSDCHVYGAGTYNFGDTINLEAQTPDGYRFAGWTDGDRNNNRALFASGGTYNFTATFEPLQGDTLSYCRENSHCLTRYGTNTWGIKLPASTLTAGHPLTSAMLYVGEVGTYTLKVYLGSDYSSPVATSQATYIDSTGLNQWNTFTLTNNVTIDGTQDIIIAFTCNDANYPATVTHWCGNTNGFLYGSGLQAYGNRYTFMIRGIFDSDVVISGDTISYCGNFAPSTYTYGSGSTVEKQWGIMFPGGTMPGNYLKSVLLYVSRNYQGIYTLKIYRGGNDAPGTLVHTQPVNITAEQDGWQEILLNDTLPIDNQNIWITFLTDGFTYPATFCGYPNDDYSGSPNSNWFRDLNDHNVWSHPPYNMSWLIKAVVADSVNARTYTINVNANDATMGFVSGSGSYLEGTSAILTANSNTGFKFLHWNDGNTDNLRTVTVTGNASYTAIFDTAYYTITVISNNLAWGTVTGGGTYRDGETITITATAGGSEGGYFSSWNDQDYNSTRNVTVTGDTTYMAIFGPNSCPAITSFPYSWGFEGIMGCWNPVDANNDNSTWRVSTKVTFSSASSIMPHTGLGMAGSYSWYSNVAYNANDYLVSPQFQLPQNQYVTLSWWFRVNPSYPADNLAVKVSTTSSDIADFTTTLIDITPTADNGVWTHQTLDLSAYAGQSIYLAFYHHDAYDMNYILIDDVEITTSAAQPVFHTVTVLINDSTMGSVTGSSSYLHGSTATLTATPARGHRFMQWSDGNGDNPRTVTVNSDITVTAIFAPIQYTITATSDNPTLGTVTGGGTYNVGDTAIITATPAQHCHFAGWSDSSTINPRTIIVSGDLSFTAHFLPPVYHTVTATSANNDMGTVTGGGSYIDSTEATLTATPATGHHFVAWMDGNTQVSTENPYVFTVTSDVSLTAIFEVNTIEPDTDTISYCGNNAFVTGIHAGGEPFYWAIKLTPTELAGHTYLKSVMVYVSIAETYDLMVYSGDGTLLHNQIYNFGEADTLWQEIQFDALVTIPENQDLWIILQSTFATACNYLNNPNSDLISLDGSSWAHLGDYSLNYSWLIKAVTTNTIPQLPPPSVYISGPSYVITGEPQTFTATTAADATVTWTLNGATPLTATGLTATATWNAAGTYNVIATATNNNGTGSDTLVVHAVNCNTITTFPYVMTFESNEIEQIICWSAIDADGDGYGWDINSFAGSIGSASYINNVGALTPDNWLITPQMYFTTGSNYTLSWKTWAPDTTYYAEHYGVYVSTSGNETSNFTLVHEYTMSSADTTTMTLDLSSFAGQTIYIAFRHWNVTDVYWILLDDITVTQTPIPGQNYTITVQSASPTMGSVTGSGTFPSGTTTTISAIANTGYHFVQWQDGNEENPRTITVNGNATYIAIFEANPPTQYTVTATSNNTAWGTVTGSGIYNEGMTAILIATANDGYRFVSWNDGNIDNPRVVTVNGDASYIAIFEEIPPTQYTVTVSSNNPAWGTVTGGGTYVEGTDVTITANAAVGCRFVRWNDMDTNAIRTITVTANVAYVAFFDTIIIPRYTVSVTSNNDAWGTVTGGGEYEEGTEVTFTATANTGYHFVQWNDGNENATRTITVTSNVSYTATFAQNGSEITFYTVTVLSNNETMGTVTGGGSYAAGSQVELAAIPAQGYHFVQWNDGNDNATRTVTVTGDITYTAYFEANPVVTYNVTALSNNDAWGTVSGSGTYNEGEVAILTALPNQGYHFAQWNDGNVDNPRIVNVLGNASYTAYFEADAPTQYTLTVVSNNPAWGTVTGGGTYAAGTPVELTATPEDGYHFVNWSDGNTNASRVVTVTENAVYVATFEANPAQQYTLTVLSNDTLMGRVIGDGVYNEGTAVTIGAIPNSGYHFVQWNDGDTNASRVIVVTQNATYVATFAANTGIDDVDALSVMLYPNPTSNYVTISGLNVQATVTIVDATGRQQGVYTATGEQMTLDVSGLSVGQYFLRIASNGCVAVKKLIIE